jgi:glycosyltransferase involved in cell wall biosynthesis
LPIYNEQPNLAPLFEEIAIALEDLPHEIVAVDDGSTDGSLSELHRLCVQYPSVRVLALEGRSGQSAATAAGFAAVRGDVVITIDADGQNDPADIPTLLEALAREPSLAAAVGYRLQRADSGWRRVQSRIANTVRNWITRDGMRDTGCSLKAVRTSVLATIPRFNGMHRFLPALIQAQGGDVRQLPVRHRPRLAGQSKYGMRDRAVRGLVDAMAVRWYRRRALRYALKEDTG